MKSNLVLICLLMFTLERLFAQSETNPRGQDCSNYNAFLSGETFDDLNYYMDTIYPSGIMRFNLEKSSEYAGIGALYSLLGVESGNTFVLIDTVNSRFNSEERYLRYQQYYSGIKVDGGGYTVGLNIPAPPPRANA
jgi:hypothetical protein